MTTPVIHTRDLDVTLEGTPILTGINLTIETGEVVALLGENGSGKSTLLRAITGLVPASVGEVRVFGSPMRARGRVAWDRIGYVPQRIPTSSGVPATAAEVVRTGLLRRPWVRLPKDATVQVQTALAAVGLAHRADDPVASLSGGQQQRVAIARALVRNPDLLILDEPTAGVDQQRQESLARILGQLRDQGKTILIVLHDLGFFAPIIDRAVTIAQGQIAHSCAVIDGQPVHVSPDEDAHHRFPPKPDPDDLPDQDESVFAGAANRLGW